MIVRSAHPEDRRRIWALNDIPNIGETADSSLPLSLPVPDLPPAAFPDLHDVQHSFFGAGGEFVVAEVDGALVGMGGFRPREEARVEVLRVRVHPATRRQGVGREVMAELERRAQRRGFRQIVLDTATNQPEAMAFYSALGYSEVGRETRPEWEWTLVYFSKDLGCD
jgi:ribosomal protein S18 acetylase RimI-like enzyme